MDTQNTKFNINWVPFNLQPGTLEANITPQA